MKGKDGYAKNAAGLFRCTTMYAATVAKGKLDRTEENR